jgi:SMC interacting uncharacterized protein involved in chromosome segregation
VGTPCEAEDEVKKKRISPEKAAKLRAEAREYDERLEKLAIQIETLLGETCNLSQPYLYKECVAIRVEKLERLVALLEKA